MPQVSGEQSKVVFSNEVTNTLMMLEKAAVKDELAKIFHEIIVGIIQVFCEMLSVNDGRSAKQRCEEIVLGDRWPSVAIFYVFNDGKIVIEFIRITPPDGSTPGGGPGPPGLGPRDGPDEPISGTRECVAVLLVGIPAMDRLRK
jgi:hypothetical protein